MEKLPRRKVIRLKEYDYSRQGIYFITICTKNKESSLSEIVGADSIRPPEIKLKPIGIIARKYILKIPLVYENAEIDEYVIMPNHLHLLLRLKDYNGRMVSAPTIVGQF